MCPACFEDCWGSYRLHGETAWLCSRCADMKDSGLVPGPRLLNTQPPRALRVGEQLRSPEGVWDVISSERVDTRKDGTRQQARRYVLTREDSHEEEWRGHDMVDFHLIPAEFEHIIRARCNELGSALTAAGLPWEDNGRQDTPGVWHTPPPAPAAASGPSGPSLESTSTRGSRRACGGPCASPRRTRAPSCPPGPSPTASESSLRERPAAPVAPGGLRRPVRDLQRTRRPAVSPLVRHRLHRRGRPPRRRTPRPGREKPRAEHTRPLSGGVNRLP